MATTTYVQVTNNTQNVPINSTNSQALNPQLVPGKAGIPGLSTTVMGVGGGVGDFASDVGYSTKPNIPINSQPAVGYGSTAINTTYNTTTQTNSALGTTVMGVGGGVGDFAADVGYSTKPNIPINNLNLENTNLNINVNTTNTTINQYNQTTATNVMGVGGGIGDFAQDVTYSTKPNEQTQNINLGTEGVLTNLTNTITTTTTTTTTTKNEGNVMGFGIGGDFAKDVTYSTKPDNQNLQIVNTELTTNVDSTNYNITSENANMNQEIERYSQTTFLPDKVQNIVQKEYQPVIRTIIKPILQKEYQPIVEREVRPILQKEIQPIIQREIQPIIQRELQPVTK